MEAGVNLYAMKVNLKAKFPLKASKFYDINKPLLVDKMALGGNSELWSSVYSTF